MNFEAFCSLNTPIKKTPKHEIPCCHLVLRNLPLKWKLLRKSWSFFVTTRSILAAKISGSVRILFSIYILIRKVFTQLFRNGLEYFVSFLVFELEGKMLERNVNFSKIQFFWIGKKILRALALAVFYNYKSLNWSKCKNQSIHSWVIEGRMVNPNSKAIFLGHL